ncbi:LysR family transcriptional regulator substrate-binding protein [Streptomyces sp. NPDC051976]|uniref:LysR family transcriptional regulator substrate-binding protein n=1 Tax=Streptomyces sp. NPDC051976 TaxID=3154947 RepID=UPI00342EA8F6
MTSPPTPVPPPAAPGAPSEATRGTPAHLSPAAAGRDPRVRIGVHGSPRLVDALLAGCGHGDDGVHRLPYNMTEPFAPLRAGEVDLMIVKYTPREPDLATSGPIGYDGRAALMRAGHPLAGAASVTLEQLSGYDAFACPDGFPPYVWDLVVPPRTARGVAVRRVHPMTTLTQAAAVLAATDAVHPSFASVADALPPGILAVPVSDLPPAPVRWAWRRASGLTPAAARLVRDAEQAAERYAGAAGAADR